MLLCDFQVRAPNVETKICALLIVMFTQGRRLYRSSECTGHDCISRSSACLISDVHTRSEATTLQNAETMIAYLGVVEGTRVKRPCTDYID